MSAVSTLILVCSVSMSSADCTPGAAIEFIRGPNANSLLECAARGQAALAATALTYAAEDRYVKIMCVAPEQADAILREASYCARQTCVMRRRIDPYDGDLTQAASAAPPRPPASQTAGVAP
jgi:hypothetical protein